MVLCPPFPNKEQDTGPIILVIIILQKIRYTADFEKARQSKAFIETAHLDPTADYIHAPDNVCFAHRTCNIAQGDRSTSEFLEWISGILDRYKAANK
jgi:hypothetical protein